MQGSIDWNAQRDAQDARDRLAQAVEMEFRQGYRDSVRILAHYKRADEKIVAPYAIFNAGNRLRMLPVNCQDPNDDSGALSHRAYWATHSGQLFVHWNRKKFPEKPLDHNLAGVRVKFFMGQNFWRTQHQVWVQSAWRYTACDEMHRIIGWHYEDYTLMITVKKTSDGPRGLLNEVEEMPLSKFLFEYNPYPNLVHTEAYRKARARHLRGKGPYLEPPDPQYVYGASLLTLCKCMIKFYRQLKAIRHRDYQPGGVGAKRARDEFEACVGPRNEGD